MVGLLALAHDRACEAELASELEAIAATGELPDLAELRRQFMPSSMAVPNRHSHLAGRRCLRCIAQRAPGVAPVMTAIEVDTTRLPLLLQELRLPAVARLWPEFTERSDKEGWPAARLLSVLAELEIAERGRRRIERHLAEARLPPGKTLDNFDFATVPMLSKARVMALAAGDAWLGQGTQTCCCSDRQAQARVTAQSPSAAH